MATPVRPDAPQAARVGVVQRAEADRQPCEDAVVRAGEGLDRERDAEPHASTRSRAIEHAMERLQRQRQAERHHQLDVRGAGEQEGTVGEGHRERRGGPRRRPERLGKAPREHERQHEPREDGAVVRRVRIAAGRQVEGHAERTRHDVGLGVGQRVAVGMKDVGLEERRGVRGEGVGHPVHVPHAPFAITEVEARGAVELARHRPGHGRCEQQPQDQAPAPCRGASGRHGGVW